MSNAVYDFKQVSVSLDAKDKEALTKINSILDGAGVAAALLSALHVYSWANLDTGIVSVGLEDWNQVAKAILGCNSFALAGIHRIIARQMLRHKLNGTDEQYQFWASYESAVVSAIKRR
ncbi:MAG: hypothetical protein GY774_11945 [Planctomycetes bacterium]|nr:hypothetical protein [Planctomycetota bacterium]